MGTCTSNSGGRPRTPQWRDVSGSDAEGVPLGRTFELQVAWLRITVTRHVYLDKDQWGLSCHEIALGSAFPVVLQSRDIEDAKREALGLVRAKLFTAVDALGRD